jgi:hypothetical protein
MAKNIVICADGTGDEYGATITNVARFFAALNRSDPTRQVAAYFPGIGTIPSPSALTALSRLATKLASLAVGYGLMDLVAQTYAFLMAHYIRGDRICGGLALCASRNPSVTTAPTLSPHRPELRDLIAPARSFCKRVEVFLASTPKLRARTTQQQVSGRRSPTCKWPNYNNLGLEAPPGFEPGMEVLQTVQGCES